MLKNKTVEELQEMREKARLVRESKREAGKHLKEFMDENHWRSLASKYGVRLPISYIPATETKYIKRIAKKLSVDLQEWLEGDKLSAFGKDNPDWSAAAHAGLFLEWYDEKMEEMK